jgi:hypothetical protein
LRPMMPEVVLDVINTALGVTENFGADAPQGARAIEVGSSRVQNGNLAFAFRIFGRPPRTSACDCERALDPALPQTLYRMTDSLLLGKLEKGRLQELLANGHTNDEILEELFLATLTRLPTEAEKQHFAAYLEKRKKGPKVTAALTTLRVKEDPALVTKGGKKGTGQTLLTAEKAKGGPKPGMIPKKTEPPDQLIRRAAFVDTLWALVNTREFILNH